jgi:hypothetical protein
MRRKLVSSLRIILVNLSITIPSPPKRTMGDRVEQDASPAHVLREAGNR